MMAVTQLHGHEGHVPDELVLITCAAWRLARLRAQLVWAEDGRASLFGAVKGWDRTRAPVQELTQMRELEDQLSELRPDTFRGAEAMLDVAAEILAHASYRPDDTLAGGPVLAIVVKVRDALGHPDGGARLVPER